MKPGKALYDNITQTLYVPRFSALTYKQEWPKYLAEQRELGIRAIKAKAVLVRFELGLPLI